MIFKKNFYWIRKDESLVTSLLVWNNIYIPTQIIIFRVDFELLSNFIIYFKHEDMLIGKFIQIQESRTNTENELEFHIAFKIKWLLDEVQISNKGVKSDFDVYEDHEFNRIVHEVFMSDIAMTLMMEEHPKFGFYSLSPNIKKIETILSGRKDDLYEKLLSMRRR